MGQSSLTRLQEIILSLFAVGVKIQSNLKAFKYVKVNTGVRIIACDYSVILTCNFLEGWQRLEKYAKYSSEVRKTLRFSAVILKRIRKWKDIYKYRNQLIAHNNRDKCGNIVFAADFFSKHKAPSPSDYGEKIILLELAMSAIQLLIIRHRNDFVYAIKNMLKEKGWNSKEIPGSSIMDHVTKLVDVDQEIARIKKKTAKLIADEENIKLPTPQNEV